MRSDFWCMAAALLIVGAIIYAFARGPRRRSRPGLSGPTFTNSLRNPRLHEDEPVFDDDF